MITTEEILQNEVRALSWKQPYAELMTRGKQETRTWATDYRGLVLICASAQPYSDRELIQIAGDVQYPRILGVLGKKWFNSVKRGNAIAVGRLTDCIPAREWGKVGRRAGWEHATFVNFNINLYTHIYEDVTLIEPFPWRGVQGWKTLTDEEKQKIKPL